MKNQKTGSMTRLVEAAFAQASMEVIRRAKQTGTPVIVWEDNRVKAVSPEDLEPPKSASRKRPRGGARKRKG
jgi:hypothetical protein